MALYLVFKEHPDAATRLRQTFALVTRTPRVARWYPLRTLREGSRLAVFSASRSCFYTGDFILFSLGRFFCFGLVLPSALRCRASTFMSALLLYSPVCNFFYT
ncbi:MAG: hypothetical protein D6691_12360 [Candidatus Hydrogenedentota bacterium]|nr:MAG: hypothetical protein D6691_12360 [Candidatus Hydrogenedentota bacterium]